MITAFIMGVLAGIATLAVITVFAITAKWVIEIVKDRKTRDKDHKIVFADTKGTIDSHIEEQKKKQKEYSMDELYKLHRFCQEVPYLIVDYDRDTKKLVNYTAIKAEKIDADVESRLKKVGGLVVFD